MQCSYRSTCHNALAIPSHAPSTATRMRNPTVGNIEDYITTTSVNTEQANVEIDKSYIQQKKARKRTCLLVIILLTALLIFLLILTRSLTSK